jgi:hypothetical protein
MTDLKALLERLRQAERPDRYADCHLWVIAQGGDARMVVCDSSTQDFVWERGIDGMWIRSVVRFRAVPKYTASIDAALALVARVLPGWAWLKKSERVITLYRPLTEEEDATKAWATHYDADGATIPIAILAALLTALIAKDSQP